MHGGQLMSALRVFYSPQEIADLRLPNMPGTKMGIHKRVSAEGWVSRPRKAQGGGLEYALPQWALLHINMLERRNALAKAPAPTPAPDTSRLAEARTFIVAEIRNLSDSGFVSRWAATQAVTEAYHADDEDSRLVAPQWVREALPSFSARTAQRWLKTALSKGSEGLRDKKRGPQHGTILDRDANMRAYVVSQITARPHLKATTLRKGLQAAGFDPVPSVRYLQQLVREWKDDTARNLMMASDPDAYRSKYLPAMGSKSAAVTRLNQIWEVDGTKFDVMCITPDGNEMRYSLTAMVDVYSRRAKVLVSRQPSAITVGLLIRACILDWGLPETIKADNGKDYTAAYIGRITHDLGITLDYCAPFNPQEKPHVERFYKTLNHGLAEILPGYVGHNVTDRKAIESRRSMAGRHGKTLSTIKATLTGGELQHVIDAWIEHDYHHELHKGLQKSPAIRALEGGTPIRIRDERALDLLLADSPGRDGIRTVSKKGVSVHGRNYIAPELGGVIGEKVHVKFAPDDLTRIYLYSADRERFLCIAEDPTLDHVDQEDIAKRAKQAQRQEAKVFKAEMRAAQDAHSPDELAASILASKAQSSSKVVPFMRPARDIDAPVTPAFVRERVAANQGAAPAPKPVPLTEEQIETAAEQFAIYDDQDSVITPMVTRADGTQRPLFLDDVEFAGWLRDATGPLHPEDIADMRALLVDEGPTLEWRLETANLTEFITTVITGDAP